MRAFFDRVALDPRWWRVLFWINLLGSGYGFWWYRAQLLATPVAQWLVVPDSPGSTLLFAIFVLALLRGAVGSAPDKQPIWLTGWVGWLAALALVSNMKYGLWTAIVLPQAGIVTGFWTFDHVHLSLSHFGMWLQAVLFLRWYRPPLPAALVAWGLMYVQDYLDYWALGTHPTLPVDALEPSVRLIALGLSTVWGLYLTVRSLTPTTSSQRSA